MFDRSIREIARLAAYRVTERMESVLGSMQLTPSPT